ncbi:MAG: radical SAM protein, partial [Verrucomicrobiota bacterium]
LTEALKHPFFQSIREGIPYDGNLLRPCMLIDHPEVFRKYADEYKPKPTHEGAETLITDLSQPLSERAAAWKEITEKAWQQGDYFGLYPYPPDEKTG